MYCYNPHCDQYNTPQKVIMAGGRTEPEYPVFDTCTCGSELKDNPIDTALIGEKVYDDYIEGLGDLSTELQKWRAEYIHQLTGAEVDDPEILAEAMMYYYEHAMGDLSTEAQRILANELMGIEWEEYE